MRQDPVVMLAAFESGAAGLRVYETAARRADIRFGLVTDASLLPELDLPGEEDIVLMYRSFDERIVRFDMDFTVENLNRFVDAKSLPSWLSSTRHLRTETFSDACLNFAPRKLSPSPILRMQRSAMGLNRR